MGGRGGGSSLASKATVPSATPAPSPPPPQPVAPTPPLQRPAGESITTGLGAVATRAEARSLLQGQSGKQLKAIATELGMRGLPATKAELTDAIIEFTVGNRIRSAAIRGL